MKNLQLEEEAERWKRLCLQELGGLRRLRRKGREPPKPCGRAPREDPRPHVRPGGEAGASRAGATPADGRLSEVLDGSKALLASQQQQREDTCLGASRLNGAGAQGFLDPSLPSRLVGCAQQPTQHHEQQQRPLESPYSSLPHGIYAPSHPESSPSPRKRLGEAAGVPSEVKAIQQTRRLLANARERTRVHTISAAFEALRKQVPCYSYGQKLSKLAILRIACNYILSLAKLADLDYSADHSNMSFSECVEQCTRTLQAEGRSKKRKVNIAILILNKELFFLYGCSLAFLVGMTSAAIGEGRHAAVVVLKKGDNMRLFLLVSTLRNENGGSGFNRSPDVPSIIVKALLSS